MPGSKLDRPVPGDQPSITKPKHQMQFDHEVGRVLGRPKVLSSPRYSLDEDSAIFSGSEGKERLPCIPMQVFAESYSGLKVKSLLKTEYLTGIIVPVLYQIGIERHKDLITRESNSGFEENLLFKLFSNQEFHCGCEGNCDYPESGLLWAARMGKEELLGLLLDEKDINVNYKPQDGITALHLATKYGYEAIAKQLLEKGSSVDCQDSSSETPLHYAAENGDRSLVALLLEYGANVHHLDIVGSNPLQKAVKIGIQNVIELLINHGANINEQNNLGWTALHIAAAYGKPVHLLLLKEGARINTKDIHGQTPLHKAVQKKEKSIIKDLIEYGANINLQDNSGFSPLHIAADLGCDGIIKLLVENGAMIDLRNRDGYTPLRVASFNGDRGTVRQLLSLSELSSSLHFPEVVPQANVKNAGLAKRPYHENKLQGQRIDVKRIRLNPSEKTTQSNGTTPPIFKLPEDILYKIAKVYLESKDINLLVRTNRYLATLFTPLFHIKVIETKSQQITFSWVAKKGNEPIFRLLLRKSVQSMHPHSLLNSEFPIHWAASTGDERVVRYLLDINPGSVDLQNFCGDTALHLAARYGHSMVAELLIDKGADINKKNKFLKTPLQYAAKKGCVSVVEQLIKKGVNIEDLDYQGTKALHKAAQGGSENVVKILLESGASVNNHGNSERTELHFAAQFGSDTMVEMLLQKGCKVNIRDKYGDTPLHKAAERGDISIASLLLDKKANLNIKNGLGYAPVHTAVELGSIEVLTLLVDNGVDLNAQSFYGDTVMHLAVFNRDIEMMSLLLRMGAERDITDIMGATPLDWVKSWAFLDCGEAP